MAGTNSHKTPVFVTDDGREVHYQTISMIEVEMAMNGLEEEYRDRGEPLAPPTYKVPVAGGGEEEFELDEDSLSVKPSEMAEILSRDPGTKKKLQEDPSFAEREAERFNRENRKKWAAHRDAAERLRQEQQNLRQEMIFLDAILDEPDGDAWEKRQRKRHIKIPEGEDEKRLHWILTALLRTPNDMVGLIEAIMTASTKGVVSPEQMRAATRSFRRIVHIEPESGEVKVEDYPAGEDRE